MTAPRRPALPGIAATCSHARRLVATALAAAAIAAPALSGAATVSPSSLNFGGQPMATSSAPAGVTFTNNTASPVVPLGIYTWSSQFAITHDCGVLDPGESCTIIVTFRPDAVPGAALSSIPVTDTLAIETTDPASPTLVGLTATVERSLVKHYYRTILRREPEAGAVPYWEGEVARLQSSGANPNEVWYAMATFFFFGPEYALLGRDTAGFVTDLYAAFLNRTPDPAGLSQWVAQINGGTPRDVVLANFLFAPEFATFLQGIFANVATRMEVDTVGDFYRGVLSRLPDSAGLGAWVQAFRSAQCSGSSAVFAQADAISGAFVGSAEYVARSRTNAQFVGDMYNAFLRRGGDAAGIQGWVTLLANGSRTRDQVRQGFMQSPEFTARVNAIAAQGCIGTQSPHPRLWLSDAATRTRVTAAAQSNSPEWVALKNFCDTRNLTTSDYQGGEAYKYLGNFSLCYRMVKTLSGDAAAAPYAQKALNILTATGNPVLNFTAYSTDSGYGIRNYGPALALAYDWLYDSPLLTPTIKGQIVTRINAWLNWYASSGYANNAPISNYHAGYNVAGVLAAIALAGEDASAGAIWQGAIARYNAAHLTFDTFMPGGHWPEGWNYGPLVYQSYLLSGAALRFATGDASYVTARAWLQNGVLTKFHSLTPDGKWYYDDGLWSGDSWGGVAAHDVNAAGFAFGWSTPTGRIARAYLDRARAGGAQLDENAWKAFLFYDPASVPVDANTLSRSHHATGTGLVAMRSDWTSPSATWATFITGRYLSYQGEQDMDQGHMTIYRTAPLLIDVGHALYTSEGSFRNTIFHNTYTMEGRTDYTPYTSFTSGQLDRTDGCPNPLGTNPIGINGYNDAGSYVFTSGEFSAAYQHPPQNWPDPCGTIPVSWMNRSVLYVRPGVFAVYDQVRKLPSQAQVAPTMHWHFPTQPALVNASARTLSLDNGGGRLQVASVYPGDSVVNLAYNPKGTDGPGVSNWHLAVTYPSQAAGYQNFLTVMRAGLANPSYAYPNVGGIVGIAAFGSYVSGLLPEEGTTPLALVFADNGTLAPPASLQYQYVSTTTTRNYVAKLKPGTRYLVTPAVAGSVVTVTVTENAGGTLTDAAGVLAFTL